MNFTLDKSTLLTALQRVAGIVPRANTIPIISHVLIDTHKDGRIVFRGTNLDMEAVVTVRGTVTKMGATTVSAALLLNIAKNAADGAEIQFDLKDRLHIKSGRSNFKLAILPPADFPSFAALDEPAIFEIPSADLEGLFGCVAFSQGIDATRQYLQGVYFCRDGDTLVTVASDGKRLAMANVHTALTDDFGVIVPAQMVAEIGRGLATAVESVLVEMNRSKIKVTAGDTVITSKLLDYPFQDFRRVVPKALEQTLTVGAAAMRSAIMRAMVAVDDTARSAQLEIAPGSIRIKAHTIEASAEDEVECTYDGPEMTIGINSAHMMDAVGACESEDVIIRFTDKKTALIVSAPGDDGFQAVFMPLVA